MGGGGGVGGLIQRKQGKWGGSGEIQSPEASFQWPKHKKEIYPRVLSIKKLTLTGQCRERKLPHQAVTNHTVLNAGLELGLLSLYQGAGHQGQGCPEQVLVKEAQGAPLGDNVQGNTCQSAIRDRQG